MSELTDTHRQILALLPDGPLAQGALRARLGKSASALSHHLTALEDASFIERRRDGRHKTVAITPAGRRALAADLPPHRLLADDGEVAREDELVASRPQVLVESAALALLHDLLRTPLSEAAAAAAARLAQRTEATLEAEAVHDRVVVPGEDLHLALVGVAAEFQDETKRNHLGPELRRLITRAPELLPGGRLLLAVLAQSVAHRMGLRGTKAGRDGRDDLIRATVELARPLGEDEGENVLVRPLALAVLGKAAQVVGKTAEEARVWRALGSLPDDLPGHVESALAGRRTYLRDLGRFNAMVLRYSSKALDPHFQAQWARSWPSPLAGAVRSWPDVSLAACEDALDMMSQPYAWGAALLETTPGSPEIPRDVRPFGGVTQLFRDHGVALGQKNGLDRPTRLTQPDYLRMIVNNLWPPSLVAMDIAAQGGLGSRPVSWEEAR